MLTLLSSTRTDYPKGIDSWNTLVSLIQSVSVVIGSCFLAVQTSGAIALLCYAARVLKLVIAVRSSGLTFQHMIVLLDVSSLILLAAGPFAHLVKAANVTSSCSRVPQIVNSSHVTLANAVNFERQHLVSFMANSKAGFSINGTQLNANFLMNYCYIGGAIVCGIFTTGLSVS